MPPQLTYPGVYVEEIPSGVRTITGVATSITAFVGRTRRGPVAEPFTIYSYADFERNFGGLWLDSPLGYAVRDFYLNGGTQAIIVRLYRAPDGGGVAKLTVGDVTLIAASPGAWGGGLRASIDVTDVPADQPDAFNLTVTDTSPGGRSERFVAVSLKSDSTRRLDHVLERSSELVRWGGAADPDQANAPAAAEDAASGAEGADAAAVKDLADKQKAAKAAKQALDQAQAALAAAGPTPPQELKDAVDAAQTASTNADKAVTDAQTALDSAKADVTAKVTATGADDGGVLDETAFTATPGLDALDRADLFNLLCIPPHEQGKDIEPDLVGTAAAYCEQRRAMLLVDPPSDWQSTNAAADGFVAEPDEIGTRSRNAAIFFPRLWEADPERGGPSPGVRALRSRRRRLRPHRLRRAASGRRRPASTRTSAARAT